MSSLKQRVQDGISGKYVGLENGFKDLNKVLFGVQKKCYTLIGGQSGTYKTTLLDFIFLNAIQDAKAKNIPIDVFYYSFEIDKLSKQCNWLSQLVYKTYGRVIPPEKIKGLGGNRMTSDELEMVESLIPELEELFDSINFVFDATNPTGIYNDIYKHCAALGDFKYSKYTDDSGEEKKRVESFKFREDRYVLIGIDHIVLSKKERNFTTKENLDKLSQYMLILRNIFDVSPFLIQQFNMGMSATERQKFKGVDLSPSQTDFKDSTNPYQDCDVALGIINPYKLDMETYLGYDTSKLKDKFIALKVIKNRLSKDNVAKGLLAKPEIGSFVELPKANIINYADYM